MNDFQVIGYPCLHKELWDRQGANSASRQKEMYGEKLFRRPQKPFWGAINAFSPSFDSKQFGQCLICGKCKFCMNDPEICDKTYRLAPLLA